MTSRLVKGVWALGLLVVAVFSRGCTAQDSHGEVHETATLRQGLTQGDLRVYVRNEAPWENNTVKPRIYIVNQSSEPLVNFKAHYFFTVDPGKAPVLDDYYTPLSVPTLQNLGNGLWRVVYDYQGYTLWPGASTDTNTPPSGNVIGLRYSDWSTWNKADDWSYQGVTGTFSQTNRIVVLDGGGSIVHGSAPDGVFPPDPQEPPVAGVHPKHRVWFSVELPTPLDSSNVALGASSQLQLEDGARVSAPDGMNHRAVSNTGPGLTKVGKHAKTGSVYGGGHTHIRQSLVYGDVVSAGTLQVEPGSLITGTTSPPFSQFEVTSRTWSVVFPDEPQSLPDLAWGQTHSIGPGAYGSLNAQTGETFELNQPGEYYFDSINLDLGSTLRLKNASGPIFVYVKERFTFRGAIQKTDEQQFNVQFAYAGQEEVPLDKAFKGTLIAPRATIKLSPLALGQSHRGAFYAKSIDVRPNTHVQHWPLAVNCAVEQQHCRSSFACALPDTDSDLIPDCEEERDDDPWTNPEVQNGFTLQWGPRCQEAQEFSCSLVDEREKIQSCRESSTESKIMSAGWSWSSVGSPNICNTGYGFTPRWDLCADDWHVAGFGVLRMREAGRHCFRMVAGEGSCTSLLIGDADTAQTSDEASVCYDLAEGEHPIEWIHEGRGSSDSLGLLYCYGRLEDCTPTRGIPLDMVRPSGCRDSDDCTGPNCPCAQEIVRCTSSSDCLAEGHICPQSPNGGLFDLASDAHVCVSAGCELDPSQPGCSSPARTCETNSDCPNGQPCLSVGLRFGDRPTAKYCVDPNVCGGPEAASLCGNWGTKCGLCECAPNCSGKVCGGDLSDGCGGFCEGTCDSGQQGCKWDLECPGVERCDSGRCVDPSCYDLDACDPEICGDLCVTSCLPDWRGRECGVDPQCGVEIGTCEEGSECSGGICTVTEEERPDVPERLAELVETAPIGALPGSFDVSNRGAATYSIPLDLPVGRGGVRPNIALTYDGSLTVGEAGVGWNVTGRSEITRCPKTAAVDGWPAPPSGEPDDAFCLDGRRLILVSGDAGQDGAEYRTEVETFNKLVYHTSDPQSSSERWHDYWVVHHKPGGRSYYGRASVVPNTNFEVTKSWLLTEKVNRSSIVTRYHYRLSRGNDCDSGVELGEVIDRHYSDGFPLLSPGSPIFEWRCTDETPLLAAISYGGTPQSHGPHSVRFNWEKRKGAYDIYNVAALGLLRITGIKVVFAGESIRSYDFDYVEVSGREDFLASVRECVPRQDTTQSLCKPPTTFDYVGQASEEQPSWAVPELAEQFESARQQIGAVGPATTCASVYEDCPNTASGHELLLDINGDGLLDLLWAHDSWLTEGRLQLPPTRRFRMALGTLENQQFTFSSSYSTDIRATSLSRTTIDLDRACLGPAGISDLDGDGYTDLVDGCASGGGNAYWWRSTGEGFERELIVGDLSPREQVFVLDRDGDGYPEIATCTDTHLTLLEWGPGRFGLDTPSRRSLALPDGALCSWQATGSPEPSPLILDVDGDGVSELLVRTSERVYALSGPTPGWTDTGIQSFSIRPERWRPAPMVGRSTSIGTPRVTPREDFAHKTRYGAIKAFDPDGDGLTDLLEHLQIVTGSTTWAGRPPAQSTVRTDTSVAYLWRQSRFAGWEPFRVPLIAEAPAGSSFDLEWEFFNKLTGVDVGSDRRHDLLGVFGQGSQRNVSSVHDLYMSHAPGFYRRQVDQPSFPRIHFEANAQPPIFADFDGDGALDVLLAQSAEPGDSPERTFVKGAEPARYRLVRIKDGLENEISINYDASVYRKGSCDIDSICVASAGQLVSSVNHSSNSRLERTSRYEYRDAQIGRYGRGWLGFGERLEHIDLPAKSDPMESTCGELRTVRKIHTFFDNGKTFRQNVYEKLDELYTDERRSSFDPAWNSYPFSGLPLKVVTQTAAVPNGLFSEQDSVTKFRSVWTRTYFLAQSHHRPFAFPVETVQSNWQSDLLDPEDLPEDDEVEYERLSSSFVQHHAVEALVDAYGNPFFEGVSVFDSARELVTQNYTFFDFYPPQQDGTWEVGLLRGRDTYSSTFEGGQELFKFRSAHYVYDDLGRIQQEIRALNRPGERMADFVYDEFGNVVETNESSPDQELFRSQSIIFDSNGLRPLLAIDPEGLLTQFDIDAATGRVHSVVDPNGVVTQYAYDLFGRNTRVRSATGWVEVRPQASAAGDGSAFEVVTTHADPSASTTQRARYDSVGRVLNVSFTGLDGVDVEQSYAYDCQGRLETEELPHPVGVPASATKTYEYDILGSLLSVTGPDAEGETRSVVYQHATVLTAPEAPQVGPFTSVTRMIDMDGIESLSYSDTHGRTVAVERGGALTGVKYGPLGDVMEHHGPSASEFIETDDYGRLIGIIDPDLGAISYTYDAFDRVETVTRADGSVEEFNYDRLDRLLSVSRSASIERFYYDSDSIAELAGEAPTENSLGRLVRSERQTPDGLVTRTFRYEPKPVSGELLWNTALLARTTLQVQGDRVTDSAPLEMLYDYVPGTSRLSLLHYPHDGSGFVSARYCYDTTGALIAVTEPSSGCDTTGQGVFWRRTSSFRGIVPDSFALGNGVQTQLTLDDRTFGLKALSHGTASGSIQFSYAHEPGGRLQLETRTGHNSDRDYLRQFGYTPAGLLASVIDLDAEESQFDLLYDSSLRLRDVERRGRDTLGTFTYQSLPGGITSNRPWVIGANEFYYDARGNQIEREGPDIVGGRQIIDYNDFNLPRVITTGFGAGSDVTSFLHDAVGSRVHTHRSQAQSESWHFDGLYEKELTQSGAEHHDYYIFAAGERVAQIRRTRPTPSSPVTQEITYLHHDRLGSLIATTNAAGELETELTYDLFGHPEQPLPIPFGYTGHRYEEHLGLTDANGRFYDAQFGMFLSADPVGPLNGGSTYGNRYSYVGYDPINFLDPTGFQAQGNDTDCFRTVSDPACGGVEVSTPWTNQEAPNELGKDENLGTDLLVGAAVVGGTAVVGGGIMYATKKEFRDDVNKWVSARADEIKNWRVQDWGIWKGCFTGSCGRSTPTIEAPGAPTGQMFGPSSAAGASIEGGRAPLWERGALASNETYAAHFLGPNYRDHETTAAEAKAIVEISVSVVAWEYAAARIIPYLARLRLLDRAARGAEKLAVTFGRNANQVEHAFRHTDKLGLSRTAVQEAIQKHLPSVADKIPSGSPLNQVIEVGGKRIQYSAFRLPDGSINVGRIHGVP